MHTIFHVFVGKVEKLLTAEISRSTVCDKNLGMYLSIYGNSHVAVLCPRYDTHYFMHGSAACILLTGTSSGFIHGLGWKGHGNFTNYNMYVPPSMSTFLGGKGIACS